MSKNTVCDQNIDRFNCQVLACQQDAFSLACYLLGDEEAACALLQDVIRNIYTGWHSKVNDVGRQILRGVILMAGEVDPSDVLQELCSIPGWEQLKRCESGSIAAGRCA